MRIEAAALCVAVAIPTSLILFMFWALVAPRRRA